MKQYKIDGYKQGFPPGTQVELISMEDDPHAVPSGTKGVVDFVDDIGTIHVTWENGRHLGVCPDVDRLRRVEVPTKSTEKMSLRQQLRDAAEKVEPRAGTVTPNKDKGER